MINTNFSIRHFFLYQVDFFKIMSFYFSDIGGLFNIPITLFLDQDFNDHELFLRFGAFYQNRDFYFCDDFLKIMAHFLLKDKYFSPRAF